MAANRRVSFVRMDARRHFIVFVAFVLFCGTSFVAGVLVGQRNPRPIDAHFDASYEAHPAAEATLASPDPARVYTFEDRLTAAETRLDREPVVEPDAPVQGQAPVGERAADPDDTSEPRVIEREPPPLVEDEVAAAEPAARIEAPAIGDTAAATPDDPIDAPARTLARAATDDDEPARVEEGAAAPSGAPAAGRTLARGADSGSQPFEVTVASEAAWDAADRSRQALRDAGLRATIVTSEVDGERRFDVVLRGEAPAAEVTRQERLAERVLASTN